MLAESSSGRGTCNGESMRKETKWPSQKNGITPRMRKVLVPRKSKHQLANGAASQFLRYTIFALNTSQKYPKLPADSTSSYSEPLMFKVCLKCDQGSPFGRSRRPAVATATGMSVPDPGQLRWCRRSLSTTQHGLNKH
jgi:hypothetical protein